MTNVQENWCRYPYDKDYSISDAGRVKCLIKNEILPQVPRVGKKSGKTECVLVKFRGRFTSVHSLVIETFGDPRPIGRHYSIDHIDRNPANNNISNLRWATRLLQAANQNHPTRKSGPTDELKKKLNALEIEKMFQLLCHDGLPLKRVAKAMGMAPGEVSCILKYMHPDY